MKNLKCYSSFILAIMLMIHARSVSAQANTDLSNLVAPTKVNVNLQPNTDNSKNLGSDTKSWKDFYLDGDVYLDGGKFISNPGLDNTFVGISAGLASSSGAHYNSAFGYVALINNTASYNSAFGYDVLYVNTTGDRNSAFGAQALHYNSTGDQNSAFGASTLYYNTGASNSAFGSYALFYNTTGSENTASGKDALLNNTTGIKNAALGNQAGIGNTSGNYNSFVGYDAGGSNTTGSQNTYLGYSTEGSGNTFTNVVGIGYQLTNTASNQARIGNSSTTSIGGWAGWSNVSDGRFKKNVKEDVSGLEFINKLRPVTYNLDVHAADEFVGKELSGDNESGESIKISEQAKSEKEKIVYTGFIAQEVETAAKEIGYDFSGIDAPKNENDFYGLRYAEFVVPLVKAVQELDQEKAKLTIENGELQSEVNELRSRLDKIESQLGITGGFNQGAINFIRATLEQNIPNPAKNTTTIGFSLPANASEAQLIITDLNGKTVDQFNHITMTQNHIEVSTLQLLAGVYSYSLYVDGKAVDTKQMVITR